MVVAHGRLLSACDRSCKVHMMSCVTDATYCNSWRSRKFVKKCSRARPRLWSRTAGKGRPLQAHEKFIHLSACLPVAACVSAGRGSLSVQGGLQLCIKGAHTQPVVAAGLPARLSPAPQLNSQSCRPCCVVYAKAGLHLAKGDSVRNCQDSL